jgi:amino acid permease
VYILFGWAGYMQLGSITEQCSNVLLCFDSPIIRAGTVAVAMANFLKYPLLVIPFRETFNALFTSDVVPYRIVIPEMILFSIMVHLIAYYLGDVGRACNLMGATSGTAIMLILPGLFYVKLHQDQVPNSGWQQAVGWFMAVMGVVMTAAGVYVV